MPVKMPKRVSTAVINSLSSGVVPRVGLEYVAVGRKEEVATLLKDLESIAEGGAAFRFLVGRYGSGKSFMLQLLRNYAMERDFVVADADLSPERKLAGSNGQGLATYRELVRNLSTKTRPDGGALAPILERWISGIMTTVTREEGLKPNDAAFDGSVERRILDVVNSMEGMVHGFDFSAVLTAYWRGHRQANDDAKDAALRWLRGEFATKTEAREALGVRVIISDDSWYDYLKLLSSFVSSIGYRGLLVLIDEAVNLYKISHRISRESNYEKLLALFNDTMQGKAEHLAFLVGGTPEFIEDQRRGLYSYEALRSRLAASRFVKDGLRDLSGPLVRLETLSHEEIFLLLEKLSEIHACHHQYERSLRASDLRDFMQEVLNRLGTSEFLTPREVVRDFISVLNLLQQNPQMTLNQIIHGTDFVPTAPGKDTDVDEASDYAEFDL